MAQIKMYSKKDRRFVNFPIACTPSEDEFDILPALKGGEYVKSLTTLIHSVIIW